MQILINIIYCFCGKIVYYTRALFCLYMTGQYTICSFCLECINAYLLCVYCMLVCVPCCLCTYSCGQRIYKILISLMNYSELHWDKEGEGGKEGTREGEKVISVSLDCNAVTGEPNTLFRNWKEAVFPNHSHIQTYICTIHATWSSSTPQAEAQVRVPMSPSTHPGSLWACIVWLWLMEIILLALG